MDERLSSPSTERSLEPIAVVLWRCLPANGAVLEIASRTGEHVTWFAAQFPGLVFRRRPAGRAQST